MRTKVSLYELRRRWARGAGPIAPRSGEGHETQDGSEIGASARHSKPEPACRNLESEGGRQLRTTTHSFICARLTYPERVRSGPVDILIPEETSDKGDLRVEDADNVCGPFRHEGEVCHVARVAAPSKRSFS